MNNPQPLPPPEAHLDQALSLLQGILPQLEAVPSPDEVLAAMRQAMSRLETVRAVFDRRVSPGRPASEQSELIAVIAAAVAMVIRGPHRVVAVRPQRNGASARYANPWAIEGRFTQYASRKVR